MASFFTYVAKYYLFFTNLIFIIAGGSFILYGALMMNWFHNYTQYFQKNYDSIPILIITLGIVMLIVSLLGLIASLKSQYHLMSVYASVFLIAFAVELLAVILYIAYTKQVFKFLGKKLEGAFRDYERDGDITLFYNKIHRALRCCGLKGMEDFLNRLAPVSCCPPNPKGKCLKETYFKRGCLEAVHKIPEEKGGIIYTILGSILGVQFVGLASSFFLVYAFRHDFETV